MNPISDLARRTLGKFKYFFRNPSFQLETNAILLAKLHLEEIRKRERIDSLRDVELKVFSQFGEDGIIQYLISRVPVPNDVFVEIGVEDYRESNTRFLLKHDNWRGLVVDAGGRNVRTIREDRVSVYHDLTSVCAFVTRENVNEIVRGAGITGDIGLLSLDIDGNEYWVWQALDVVSPRIVVCEYNSLFGPDAAVTVPYDPAFDYNTAHHSRLYFGASLAALCRLAGEKGYVFAGCTSAGNDAFFVRKDVSGNIRALDAREGYVECRFRDSRGPGGGKTFLAGTDRVRAIEHLSVHEILTGTVMPLRDALRKHQP